MGPVLDAQFIKEKKETAREWDTDKSLGTEFKLWKGQFEQTSPLEPSI